ncbi:hypothetical protein C3L33_20820, partial [Rhododendron williamsianum]
MNRALPEMLHCINTPGNIAGSFTDMSVLERQRARIKWQQEQLLNQPPCYFEGNDQFNGYSMPNHAQDFHNLISSEVGLVVKADPGLDNGWQEFGQFGGEGSGLGSSGFVNGRESVSPEKMSSAVGRESFKKRKADRNQSLKAVAEEEPNEKRIKECNEEDESKITEEYSNNSKNTTNNDNNIKRETSADTSKVSEVQKPDYIHVRARRGQATDSHSLAERVRREKISERMKYLQDLVPGCNKITGKAGMLDEIINYVQSLQRQVEFLSMKLAAVNPSLDFNIDSFFQKR